MLQNMGISSVFIDVGKEAVAHYTPCSIREMELWHSITAAETERELYSTVQSRGPGAGRNRYGWYRTLLVLVQRYRDGNYEYEYSYGTVQVGLTVRASRAKTVDWVYCIGIHTL